MGKIKDKILNSQTFMKLKHSWNMGAETGKSLKKSHKEKLKRKKDD